MSEEFLVRDTRQPGHFWADNELIDVYGPQLGAHGIAVYMALARKAINGTGECRISMRSIAGQIGISVGGVSNAMADLLNLGLARQVDPGDNRSAAVYVLADVKALVNPNYAQLRLEKPPISVHTVNAGVHTMNATVHPVNPAFTQRTRNKERKTFTRLNTKNHPNPPLQGGNQNLTVRQLRQLNDQLFSAMKDSRVDLKTAVETACARLLIPLDLAWDAVRKAGLDGAKAARQG